MPPWTSAAVAVAPWAAVALAVVLVVGRIADRILDNQRLKIAQASKIRIVIQRSRNGENMWLLPGGEDGRGHPGTDPLAATLRLRPVDGQDPPALTG